MSRAASQLPGRRGRGGGGFSYNPPNPPPPRATRAGPAITTSYVLAGLACAFAALCYAEFAAMIPIAGSAYAYAYATLGEIIAWTIGWDLTLEYAGGSVTVAIG